MSDYNVKFTHFRVPDYIGRGNSGPPHPHTLIYYSREHGWSDEDLDRWDVTPSPRGGATICQIENEDGTVGATGFALCSLSDNFCYERGRLIAENRARMALEGTRQPRIELRGEKPDNYPAYLLHKKQSSLALLEDNSEEEDD